MCNSLNIWQHYTYLQLPKHDVNIYELYKPQIKIRHKYQSINGNEKKFFCDNNA